MSVSRLSPHASWAEYFIINRLISMTMSRPWVASTSLLNHLLSGNLSVTPLFRDDTR